MPIRITCPSCSATLSVKDEYAGRAVKCPKCGGVIPAAKPAAPTAPAVPPAAPSPPPFVPARTAPLPPEPEKSPFEDLGTSDRPAKGDKFADKPVGRSTSADDEYDDRPRPKGRADDDDDVEKKPRQTGRDRDDDRPAGGPRGARRDRDADDRPAKRKRRYDDADDRPARGKKAGGGGGLTIVLVVCGTLLLVCGGIGGGVYWFFVKAKETVVKGLDQMKESLEKTAFQFNYDQLAVGTKTRKEAETLLGAGRVATTDDLDKLFPDRIDAERKAAWAAKLSQRRAVVWQNGDDSILVAFYPTADGDARLQMKEWRPKLGAAARDGVLDDVAFVRKYPLPGKGPDATGAGGEVRADDLVKAYTDDPIAADASYKDKAVVVEGKLDAIELSADGAMFARLGGADPLAAGGTQVRCAVPTGDQNAVFGCSRGQTIKFRGQCTGLGGTVVGVANAKFVTAGRDPSVSVLAADLIAAYVGSPADADEKYKEKPVTITGALVESVKGDAVFLIGTKGQTTWRIKVTYAAGLRKQFANIRAGGRIAKLKGECGGGADNTVSLNGAWIAP
jgi:predicted Zn finger-like uncharacterized protein